MNPRVRRIVIPLVIAAAAVGLVVLAVSTPKRTTPSPQQPAEQVVPAPYTAPDHQDV